MLRKKIGIFALLMVLGLGLVTACGDSSSDRSSRKESSKKDRDDDEDEDEEDKKSKKKKKKKDEEEPEEPEKPEEPEAEPEAPEEETFDADAVFADIANYEFHFTSGAGGWETTMRIHEDGTFTGTYFDYDMGDTGPGYQEGGTVYWCDFTGALGNLKQVDFYSYEADILKLEYAVEPGKEEIKNGERRIYTGAYGLEETDKLCIYAPMMSTDLLPEDYVSWVYWEFYDPDLGDAALPVEMPFYGLYNPAGYGWYSESLLVNRNVLCNRVKLPGFENKKDDYSYLEQTYEILDSSADLGFSIYNACFKNEDGLTIEEKDQQKLVDLCISHMGAKNVENLYIYPPDQDFYVMSIYKMNDLDGVPCLYASWGDSDSGVEYDAKITVIDNFIYIYALISDEDAYFRGEAASFLMSGVIPMRMYAHSDHEYGMMRGDADGKIDKDKSILAIVRSKTSKDGSTYYLVADQVTWVSSDDTEAMKKYGLTEDDMTNDYSIEDVDGKTKDYKIADGAMFFLQYEPSEDNPYTAMNIIDYLNDGPKEYLMYLYFNEKGEIIFGYEPYRP